MGCNGHGNPTDRELALPYEEEDESGASEST